jgi:hypothetical protein
VPAFVSFTGKLYWAQTLQLLFEEIGFGASEKLLQLRLRACRPMSGRPALGSTSIYRHEFQRVLCHGKDLQRNFWELLNAGRDHQLLRLRN